MTPGVRPRLVALVGPTAAGKTRLAIELAERLGLPILGADSLQVYRHLDIGSAKPTAAERARAPHYLIDLVDPDQPFTAADYAERGRRLVADLAPGLPGSRLAGALIVGGTGLYVRALTRGLIPAPPLPAAARARIAALVAAEPAAARARLAAADPETASRLAPADLVRLARALEIIETTGRPPSALRASHRFGDAPYDLLTVALHVPPAALGRAIDARIDAMIAAGLVEEVRALYARGYGPDLKPMRALGYRQIGECLAGRKALPEAVAAVKRGTRQYAKRQRTWWRAEPAVVWLDAAQARVSLGDLVRRHLQL